MKTSIQLKAKVRNLAVQNGLKPEVILRNFFLERFLERIAVSSYRDKFILKEGMLIGSMAGLYKGLRYYNSWIPVIQMNISG